MTCFLIAMPSSISAQSVFSEELSMILANEWKASLIKPCSQSIDADHFLIIDGCGKVRKPLTKLYALGE